ncbi:RNA polymerase sigma factor SigM [Catellatospora paridis]|uniref:RNA polymerase sigma factor SigM n=1 Tax=Catellatospora paridis TaxID=1617086 RepID=UPI0012D403FC|nr:RNA polymerase sigma factor SigM [Catellatospora paridis]
MTGQDPRTDEELLAAHAAGEPDAFGVLFRRHRDRLWAVALRTTNDREDAADALQEAMLSAHRAAARFRGEAAVTTWLHRIVVNACVDRLRRRQAHLTVPLPGQAGADDDDRHAPSRNEPAAPSTDHDTAMVVRAALAELPYDQRAALVLVDLQGYSVAEVAQLMGVAEGTIKSRCSRGRSRLAVMLGHLRNLSDSPDVGGTRPQDVTPGGGL